jgi:hypothetical protein
MKKHTKIYMDFFGYGIEDFIPSELSGERAVDINHIVCRGMGGSKEKDFIENLMALTRSEHNKYGDKKEYMAYLYVEHLKFIQTKRPDYRIQFERISEVYRNEVLSKLVIF